VKEELLLIVYDNGIFLVIEPLKKSTKKFDYSEKFDFNNL